MPPPLGGPPPRHGGTPPLGGGPRPLPPHLLGGPPVQLPPSVGAMRPGPPAAAPPPGNPNGLPARVAAIAAQLELPNDGSLVGTINGAWGMLFGGQPPPKDGLVTLVQTLEEALHGSQQQQKPPPPTGKGGPPPPHLQGGRGRGGFAMAPPPLRT